MKKTIVGVTAFGKVMSWVSRSRSIRLVDYLDLEDLRVLIDYKYDSTTRITTLNPSSTPLLGIPVCYGTPQPSTR